MNWDLSTVTLITILAAFWTCVIAAARARRVVWFPNVPIIAFTFLGIGLFLNRMRAPWGTYLVGGAHAVLLIALGLKLASRRN